MLKRIFVAAISMMLSCMACAQYQQDLSLNPQGEKASAYMYQSAGKLYLGTRQLTDAEVMDQIGFGLYSETYTGARKQYRAGKVMTIVGGCLTGLGFCLAIGGASNDDVEALVAGTVIGVVAQPVLGGGIAFLCVGKGRLNWLAEDHNSRRSRPNVSFGATRSGIGLAMNF
ncbi:MAG: hypothetical protein NC308_10500 [Clostridium sp.]|nr:hypothetical protein [Bacteroides sp.]MCM1199305.1 hypothetical protein [Clostridium sp.]